ncbi:hypothetical protein [Variovorax saccharolyticus]|uniref:hypothetical protein n=1 Tax=Variovorax saccharolyticus TaxID=3053516 RepID=UPI0025777385|nr:hypothetical protein [Variovorax sp. J31P216]MDM0028258.1 hypothetical protein [Variovorax sp. J31P216]
MLTHAANSEVASKFLAHGWSVRVEREPGENGGHRYHADLYRQDELKCRIALFGTFLDTEGAEEALWLRLRSWLTDYEVRPHSGDSGFQIL